MGVPIGRITTMLKKLITGLSTAASLAMAVQTASAEQMTLKFAHQWPQNEDDYVIATAIKFAKEIERRTNGALSVNFYPAQSLVKASSMHVALKSGTIDLAVYPYIYAAGAIPE